ncbi:LysR family transcriptional regulator [Marinomonas sp. A79]|uniref:LysR family transcriptional regulator n=1 Tax=Marinomonas vulgaris TaxID=2823372 RepID=A0ABS5HEI6_9GAMM|nr:LysR substrate-binding domain-containing protein [Marinomonas vulgaris]MBR7890030.1 LysR family transcriptional regulator [Marinomonas vulgaris]
MPINNKTIPSLSSLILFESSARLGTFSQAAQELCVTPTAVSKQIKQLESFLGTQLFIRQKAGLQLTPHGEQYLVSISKSLSDLSTASQELKENVITPNLNLDIGACFSHFWLIPHLDNFHESHPDITLNININNERSTSEESQQDYHVAFYYSPLQSAKPDHTLLFKERILLVCSPGFLQKRPDIAELNNLWQQPLLGIKDSPDFWENWRSWANRYGVVYQIPEKEIQMESQVAVMHAALNGVGIALAWDWHVQALLESGQLVALTKPIECDHNGFFLAKSTSGQKNDHADSFMHWVKQLAEE